MNTVKNVNCSKLLNKKRDVEEKEIILCTIQKYKATGLDDGGYKYIPISEPVTVNELVCKQCGGPEKCISENIFDKVSFPTGHRKA